MKFLLAGRWLVLLTVFLSGKASGLSDEPDIFAFFEEEAKAMQTVTASRLPLSERQSPATVYVISGEDLVASGTQTLWDALRRVPGVDVMATRAFYGEVSIRGLNKVLSNRTLVLLDGKTMLNGLFDTTYWEGIPVALDEIDRIEVVEGPASALYGANAVNGVINIITKTPAQLHGGRIRYAYGDYQTHLGSAVYGDRKGRWQYKASAAYRAANQFENEDLSASDVRKFHASLGYDLTDRGQLRISGGMADHNTQLSTGAGGAVFFDGISGFVRGDFRYRDTHVRAFWNGGRPTVREFVTDEDPVLKYDMFDVNLEHTLPLFARNRLVVGGSFRRNALRSNVYAPSPIHETFWALFFEDAWQMTQSLTLVTSGRLDRSPQSGWLVSPRASLVFSPMDRHVFRVSAGTSFRNATLTEGYVMFAQHFLTPFNLPVEFAIVGDPDLEPERMRMLELVHTGHFGPLKTRAAGFRYWLKHTISGTFPTLVVEALPNFKLQSPFANLPGETRAWGGELSAELALNGPFALFANYSHLRITGELDGQVSENGGPRHKLNGGIRMRTDRWKASLEAHWVDETVWEDADLATLSFQPGVVPDYLLLNARVAYAFSGRFEGLEVGLSAFNLADREHHQILAARSNLEPGQNGEIVRRRVSATLAYGF